MKTATGQLLSTLLASAVALLATACDDTSASSGRGAANEPPTVQTFAYAPQPALTDREASFTWRVDDPDGDPVDCLLDFGDGTATASVPSCASQSGLTHTYASDGTFSATLSADDGYAPPASATTDITVLFSYAGIWDGHYGSIVSARVTTAIPVESEGTFNAQLDANSNEIRNVWLSGTVTQDGITAGLEADMLYLGLAAHCLLAWDGTRTGDTVEGPVTNPFPTDPEDPCRFLEGSLSLTKR